MNKFKTDQEGFWAGDFGTDYIERNKSKEYLASNINFFTKSLNYAIKPSSMIEFGPNIGLNLVAAKTLYPALELHGVEINPNSAKILAENIGEENVSNTSILEYEPKETYDVSLIKGVLIHINPDSLQTVYEKLYLSSKKYILVCEYYNPSPVVIPYRGHSDKLFKRDFAGEILDKYSDLRLVDYGFCYHRDPSFPQDDVSWFLMEKNK